MTVTELLGKRLTAAITSAKQPDDKKTDTPEKAKPAVGASAHVNTSSVTAFEAHAREEHAPTPTIKDAITASKSKGSTAAPAPEKASAATPKAEPTKSGASTPKSEPTKSGASTPKAEPTKSGTSTPKPEPTKTSSASPKPEPKPIPVPAGSSITLAEDTRDGSHTGARDAKIDKLEDQIADLHAKQGLLNILPTALPGIGFLGKIVLDKAVGENTSAEIRKKITELANEKTLNFMADTLYALGAPTSVVNALDGAEKINVVPDSSMPSDAEFDSHTGVINISQSLISDVAADQKKLEQQGIISSDGEVIDEARLNASTLKEDSVKTGAVLAHEWEHAKEMDEGVVGEFNKMNDDLRAKILDSTPAGADAATKQKYLDAADDASNKLRQRMLEYRAYNSQERLQLTAGAPGKVHLTLDENEKPQPFEHAVANIRAFEDDKPLPWGPDKGVRASDLDKDQLGLFMSSIKKALDMVGASVASKASAATKPGSTNLAGAGAANITSEMPGGRFPGGRFPGEELPGGRFPGGRFPGDELPGGRFPGGRFPGEELPGGRFPGGRFPGGRFPGGRFPGGRFPGGRFPGGRFPGGRFPGDKL